MIVPNTKELIKQKNELLIMLESTQDEEEKLLIKEKLTEIETEIRNTISKNKLITIEPEPTKVKKTTNKEKKEFLEQCVEVLNTQEVKPQEVFDTVKPMIEKNLPYTYNLLTMEPTPLKEESKLKKIFKDGSTNKIIFELVYKKECKDYLELLIKLNQITNRPIKSLTHSINFFLSEVREGRYEHLTEEDIKQYYE